MEKPIAYNYVKAEQTIQQCKDAMDGMRHLKMYEAENESEKLKGYREGWNDAIKIVWKLFPMEVK